MAGARQALRPGYGIAAALLFNPLLGSLYCWSLFVTPLEAQLDLPRADISAIFSIAIVCFTAGTLAGPRVYPVASPPVLLLVVAAAAAAGLALAASGEGWWAVALGYGGLFGGAAGLGYSITLQIMALALPERRGLAAGLGVSGFAVGSILFALLLGQAVPRLGLAGAWLGLGVLFLAAGLGAATLLAHSRLKLPPRYRPGGGEAAVPGGIFALIWTGFLVAAVAGVSSIGHAATIVGSFGGSAAAATWAVVAINCGNAGGRLGAGWLCDRFPAGRIIGAAHLTAFAGFALLLAWPGALTAVACVALQGLAYGMTSGAFPGTLSILFGAANFGRYFGRLMTAWGLAGLCAPWLAGRLYDLQASYTVILWLCAGLSLVGFLVSRRLPRG